MKQKTSDFVDIVEFQLMRLHLSGRFTDLVEKALLKYSSNEYVNRWHRRGLEPQDDLYFFLFNYVEKYGRVCDDSEWELYANQFTGELLYCEGYFFNKMYGQGCCILITKEK